jgi:hypothetical protein
LSWFWPVVDAGRGAARTAMADAIQTSRSAMALVVGFMKYCIIECEKVHRSIRELNIM